MTPKIGIFAGTFDPVHKGHIAFALKALEVARLDKVYFLPERQPRGKTSVTAFATRTKALQNALKSQPALNVIELPIRQFTVAETLPRITDQFNHDELCFLFGSDVAKSLPTWPDIGMLSDFDLIIGLRTGDNESELASKLKSAGLKAQFITSPAPNLSSSQLR